MIDNLIKEDFDPFVYRKKNISCMYWSFPTYSSLASFKKDPNTLFTATNRKRVNWSVGLHEMILIYWNLIRVMLLVPDSNCKPRPWYIIMMVSAAAEKLQTDGWSNLTLFRFFETIKLLCFMEEQPNRTDTSGGLGGNYVLQCKHRFLTQNKSHAFLIVYISLIDFFTGIACVREGPLVSFIS